ncbi:serine hydrolase [Vibrio parahaemolyticus]|nr:serine hydrolase [Vibrio parahaemolyticus]
MKTFIIAWLLILLVGCDKHAVVVEASKPEFDPIIQRVEQGHAANLHSLLVWQDNKLTLELYRQGGGLDGNRQTPNVPVGQEVLHNVHSVTKSFVATLIFIAIDEGKIEGLDTSIFDFFPEYTEPDRKAKLAITLRDVLNMSTGYALDELSVPYGQGNIFSRHYNAKDLKQQFLSTQLAFDPGTKFAYSGLSTVGLSKVIEKVYGQSFTKVMKEKIFSPLDIEEYQWLPNIGSGEAGADWGLRLTSRDMGKFGLMWLNKGQYNGTKIVGEEWLNELRKSKFYSYEMGYGLHFWQVSNVENGVAAVGIGEQYIVAIPNKNAVIVTTAGNYETRSRPVLTLIQQLAELL